MGYLCKITCIVNIYISIYIQNGPNRNVSKREVDGSKSAFQWRDPGGGVDPEGPGPLSCPPAPALRGVWAGDWVLSPEPISTSLPN